MERHEYEAMARLEMSLWWYRALHAKVVCSLRRRLQGRQAVSLLDAGCGTGGLLRVLHSAFPDWSLHGIDISELAVQYARQDSAADIRQGSVTELPYADASFDVMVSTDVMYHRAVDPDVMLKECCRVLRPGGLMVLNLPAYNWLRSYHDDHVQTSQRYTLGSLTAAMSGHPLQRLYGSYWNALLFAPLVLKRKLFAGSAEHSDVGEFPPWADSLAYTLMNWENTWICRGGKLPFGSSVFAIYSRKT
jgi:2-polyprenyl-3-methyl-5-hydroxy-6-metoxy-1,4-benzoquinol methylase